MEYRTDFIIGFIGMIFYNISGVLVIWVIFRSINALEGWCFQELLFLYGFTLLVYSPMELFFDNLYAISHHVRRGSFIKYYFMPLNILFYYLSERFNLKAVGHLLMAVITLVYASVSLQLQWTIAKALLFIAFWFGGSLVFISLMLFAASMAFRIIHVDSLLVSIYKLKDFARYPVTIFSSFFRFLFTFVIPVGFIAYYPMLIFLKPIRVPVILYLSPFVGVFLFIFAYLFWNKGINSYTGTGS